MKKLNILRITNCSHGSLAGVSIFLTLKFHLYLSCSKKDSTILVESLHMHRVSSLREVLTTRGLLLNFKKAYIKKEKPSTENIIAINIHTKKEMSNVFWWYAMKHLDILFRVKTQIKKIINLNKQ